MQYPFLESAYLIVYIERVPHNRHSLSFGDDDKAAVSTLLIFAPIKMSYKPLLSHHSVIVLHNIGPLYRHKHAIVLPPCYMQDFQYALR